MGRVLAREVSLHYRRVPHSFAHHCLDLSIFNKNSSVSIMPPKTSKNKIPDILWADDNDQLVGIHHGMREGYQL